MREKVGTELRREALEVGTVRREPLNRCQRSSESKLWMTEADGESMREKSGTDVRKEALEVGSG